MTWDIFYHYWWKFGGPVHQDWRLCLTGEFLRVHLTRFLSLNTVHTFLGKAMHIDIGCANKDLNVSSQEFTPNMQISYYLLQTLPWNPHQCTKFGVTSHFSPGQSQKQSQLPLLPATKSAYFNQIPAVLLGESVLLPSIWLWHSYFSKLIWVDPNTKDRGFQHLQR